MLARYVKPEMADIWGPPDDTEFLRKRYGMWLEVLESGLYEKARKRTILYGIDALDLKVLELPTDAQVAAIVSALHIDVARIAEIEVTRRHDFASFIQSLHEQMDEANLGTLKPMLLGKLGSYAIEDPAFMAMIHRSLMIIRSSAGAAREALRRRAREHKLSYMIGRTHGQFAMPTTFGHLLLIYAYMMERNVRRLEFCIDHECAEASMAGDIGNFAGLNAFECEALLAAFGFKQSIAEPQAMVRDRHAMIVATLGVVASTVQHMAETFWIMMHGLVGELQEPFGKGQRGSVAMAQKRNPIVTEQLTTLPNLVYGDCVTAFLNVASKEWRDIGQSSTERHIFPDTLTLAHYMLERLLWLVEGMVVRTDRMDRNLARTFGTWAGQRLRDALIEQGVDHDVAYDYVQRISIDAVEGETALERLAALNAVSAEDDRTAGEVLTPDGLASVFDIPSFVNPGIEHMFRRAELSEEAPPPAS